MGEEYAKEVEHFVKEECECIKKKKQSKQTHAPLTLIQPTYPFQIVSIKFVHLERCRLGYEYILVVMDHFMRFDQAYVTKNKVFTDFHSRLHHTMGKEFENKLMARLKELSGMQGSHFATLKVYYPQGNGQVERFNGTLLSMLRTREHKENYDWKESLIKVVHAYNCSKLNKM